MRKNTNWHVAATSAMKIDLRDYADILTFETEVPIWNDRFRLDMIVIQKTSEKAVENPLVQQLCPVNLFEIKGIGSSVTIPVFYKSIAYAGLYASERSASSPLLAPDLSVNLLSRNRPKKLIRFLQDKCKFEVETSSPGMYHVKGVGFPVFIIVTKELPKDDFLYLACATDDLGDRDADLVKRLGDDISANRHLDPQTYDNYLLQLHNAYSKQKGGAAVAVKKKVKAIYEMNLVELSEENARQKEYIDKTLAKLSQENARQKEFIDKNLAELSRKHAKQKELFDKNLHDLSQQNASLSAELLECKKIIENLQKENLILKQQ